MAKCSITEVDLATPLLLVAAPVLEELEEDLLGSRSSTLLVDRDCRIVRRWCDDPRIENEFETVNVIIGASLLEEDIGTNAPGTAYTARHGVTVNGEEHFAESLRAFSCYGHPIRHPVTKRIEGVLDVSVLAARANPLLRPLVARAVRDIEQGLLDRSRVSDRTLMHAFRSAAAKSRKAVVAVGDDLVAANRRAQDMLSPTDLTLLQVLVGEQQHRKRSVAEIELESGTPVHVEVEHVPGAPRTALLRLTPGNDRRGLRPRPDAPERAPDAPVLIAGAPGTGRSTRARDRAAEQLPVETLQPSLALLEGTEQWARQFEAAAARGRGSVVIEGIDTLPGELLGLVRDRLVQQGRSALILTSGPVAALTGEAAALAASVPTHEELVPLAARRHQVPDLAVAMLREIGPHGEVHFAPSVLKTLAGQPWPGNLHELRSVVAALATRRSSGALTVEDLPVRYRTPLNDDRLTVRDLAERDVIVAALRAVNGNKVRAAESLCMSRTTLYARMRTLRITSY
jgi:transcriptional regulator of acetoin/glycerol metabolism